MSHTQGPWRLGLINYADIYSNPTSQLVALAIKDLPGTVGNALMIAAAPDMLEALLKIRLINRNLDNPSEDAAYLSERINELCEAAIAKAEGK